jgi:coenzyme F420-reducing hydrogenase beta subunit
MIKIEDKSKCCGCTACYSICPKNAIFMQEDEEGFKYPVVDREKCINCNLCEKVCPYKNEYTSKKILKEILTFGGWINDEEIRKNSTSGGIFTAISEKILDNGGLVCGAIYDNSLNVKHTIVDNLNDLKKINGSKYVQSDMGDNFKKIKEYLNNKKDVLFSGTPCQIAGLNLYLGKEYDNLYTCDIVCHGVPSPKVFNKYKNELEIKNNSKLLEINFRNKITGWKNYSFSAKFENSEEYIQKASNNEYMKAFLNDIDLRKSCPTCKFAKLPRYSDFTLGDFWGVSKYYSELDEFDKGTSLILVYTEKGKRLLEESNVFIKQCDLKKSIKYNPSILKHNKANKNREKFLKNIDEKNIEELLKLYEVKNSFFKRVLIKIKSLFI